jgi:hypothetical protein
MALRLKTIRRGAAQIMDVMGDAANVVMLVVAVLAAWRCWGNFFHYNARTGGVAAVPRTEEGWKRVWDVVWMLLQDKAHRPLVWQSTADWVAMWGALVLAVGLTVLVAAGIRWGWIRARDIVAGA